MFDEQGDRISEVLYEQLQSKLIHISYHLIRVLSNKISL